MFLESIAQLGFLQHNPESALFLHFPDSTRRIIAIKICDDLLKEEPGPEVLSSSAHVHILMECIGQAFGLPVNEQTVVIIGKAITVYENWLFKDQTKPPPLKEDEQIFWRDMFRHFSMLFSPRSDGADTEAFAQHSRLCHRVLEIFSAVGRNLMSRLTRDTWEDLLQIVLGIADFLLKRVEGECYLADD